MMTGAGSIVCAASVRVWVAKSYEKLGVECLRAIEVVRSCLFGGHAGQVLVVVVVGQHGCMRTEPSAQALGKGRLSRAASTRDSHYERIACRGLTG